jgi:hypothetical protein
MRRSKSAAPARPTDGLLTFAALPRSDEVTEAASGDPSVVDGFVGASEAGFIFSRSHSAVCTAGDAKVMLHLSGKGGVGDA